MKQDAHFGSYVSAWEGWALDARLRRRGSSGGVLTALNSFLLQDNSSRRIIATVSDPSAPVRSIPLTLTTREEVEASAGSRYAPVSNLQVLGDSSPDDVLVGKPCEVAAARQTFELKDRGANRPLLLSFFCAGTPSQNATNTLIEKLGMNPSAVVDLRYRGNGWPGEFTAEDVSGNTATMSYHQSWGGHLGRHLQWRCKLCPHGTGDHADIAVGDYWRSDGRGYPVFDSGDGNSVIIARTLRGHELLLRARAAGVLAMTNLDLDRLRSVQPLQVKRISTLWARLAGRLLAGHRIPVYRGFALTRRAIVDPKLTVRTIVGTWLRSARLGRRTTDDG
ncbi:Coenzyme F420 hydrogenase/dehydrogenase, beta subunit C-terminal domain [Microbacterium sp. NE2HP2]|uniref:Coenzyme F420 hydrogenase/dehydrogenase, beta subunit C-terminal domain n=1 Tax=Microbacterium plantarum TaxID=1816425 RepID=UPI00236564E2|nr:Coenzyme F420 hydrogenase/dehydrogenase, beta subunit C-terminal domain [Microbacterium plantarum]MDD7945817.1 Coenzyme F420 hydrogenase/dehydrogenase, beta subunit C-terminal domain [Microbacterium plantarum]